MANVLKLLRNNELFATREAARANILSKATTLGDGELWVATYGSSPNAKSIMALKRQWGTTIFDLEEIGSDIAAQIQAAIEALDNTDTAAAGKIVTAVSTVDAIATPTKTDLASVTLGGYTADASTNGAITSSDTLGAAFNKLQNNSLKYKMAQLSEAEIATLPSPSNIKEAYKVVSYTGTETAQTVYTQVGDVVKIYKDSSLINVYLGHVDDTLSGEDSTTHESSSTTVVSGTGSEALCFVNQLANGNYKLTAVDVESFLQESEFGNGLQVNGSTHVVSVKPDTTSSDAEGFISVGANGVKISGVQDAIDTSIGGVVNNLDAVVYGAGSNGTSATSDKTTAATSFTNDTTNKVVVKVTEVDGKIDAIEVKTNDIASAANVDEIDRITSTALNDLENRKADKTDLEALEDAALTGVTAGNGITVGAKTAQNTQSVAVKLKSGADNALVLNSDGLYFSTTLDCGNY